MICEWWHETAFQTIGQHRRVSMTVVSAQSGHGRRLPLDAVHRGDQLPESFLVRRPGGERPRQVVQLRQRVGGVATRVERGIDGRHRCRRGELRDGDVIRIPVTAVRGEGHHHVRADSSPLPGDPTDGLPGVGAIQPLVLVAEQRHVADAERAGRRVELGLANRGERGLARMFRCAAGVALVASALAKRGGHERRLHAFVRVPREHAAESKRLVVGVGQHGHQLEGCHRS